MGASGAGGDVVMARVTREVSVHTGRVDEQTLVRHLQEEARQAGVLEVYLQLNSEGADRTRIRRVIPIEWAVGILTR